jgi:heat shock protein HslJ
MRNKTSKDSPVLHCVFAFIAVLAIPKFAVAQSVTDGNWTLGSSRSAPNFTISGSLFSGTTGCRSFTGEFTGAISRGRMEVAPIAGQCPRVQLQAENRFLTKLRSTRSFSVRNGKLEARNPAGHLLFSATRTHRQLAEVSPASAQATQTGNGSWRPSTISGLSTVAPSSARPIVRILGSQLQISGLCNDFSGNVAMGLAAQNQGTFSVFIGSRTEKMCAAPLAEAVDAAVLSALERTTTYQLQLGQMHLLDSAGRITMMLTAL